MFQLGSKQFLVCREQDLVFKDSSYQLLCGTFYG